MQKVRQLFFSACRCMASRSFCYPIFLMAITAVLCHTVFSTGAVRVVDGANQALVYTTVKQTDRIIAMTDIRAATKYDKVAAAGVEGYTELSMERAFPVYLTVDGGTHRTMTTAMALDRMLTEQGVTVDEDDIVSASLRRLVQPNDRITIQRVEQYQVQEQEAIPFTQRYKSTSLLKEGRQRLLQEGKDGALLHTYSETTVDGVVQERQLLSTDTIRTPVEQVTLLGDGSAISNFDFSAEFPLDENGIPLEYVAVFREQIATGYWARNPRGASGMRCEAGTAAVRSTQFPYGTKLYVRTSDGKFIYGYTVTNDTGVGLVQGLIDIDLYYESYLESALNGRRIVDIYVLEYSAPPTSRGINRGGRVIVE